MGLTTEPQLWLELQDEPPPEPPTADERQWWAEQTRSRPELPADDEREFLAALPTEPDPLCGD